MGGTPCAVRPKAAGLGLNYESEVLQLTEPAGNLLCAPADFYGSVALREIDVAVVVPVFPIASLESGVRTRAPRDMAR